MLGFVTHLLEVAAEHATAVLVRPLARPSVRVAPVTLLGPLLVTRTVYVVEPPALTLATPSVLVIARSALRPTVFVSMSQSLLEFGSIASETVHTTLD